MKSLFVFIALILIGCKGKNIAVAKGKQIYLYKINYNDRNNSKFIKVLFVEDDNIYCLSVDSLKFYKKESRNAKLVEDNEITSLINSINIAELEKVNYDNCSNIDSTKDRYIIEIREKDLFKHFSFQQVLGCNPKSTGFLIEKIKKSFDRIRF
jgi:ribosomal protein L21